MGIGHPPPENRTAAQAGTWNGGEGKSNDGEFTKAVTKEQLAGRAITATLNQLRACGQPGHASPLRLALMLSDALRPLSVVQRLIVTFGGMLSLPGAVVANVVEAAQNELIAWRDGPREAERDRQERTYKKLAAQLRRPRR